MTLMRRAKGLPRYMMDVGWWRSKNWAGVGLASIGLQTCAVSYCYEHGTDGRLPLDLEDLALALGLREREVKAAVPALLAKGRWTKTDKEHEIVGFADHNPSQAEIEEYRAAKSAAGAAGNHKRHHVDKGITDQGCALCVPPATPNSSPPASQNGSQVRPPDDRSSEAEPSQPGSLSSAVQCSAVEELHRSPRQHHGDPPASADDDESLARTEAQARSVIADRRIDASTVPIANPRAYRSTVLRDVEAEHGPELRRLAGEGLTAGAIADVVEPLQVSALSSPYREQVEGEFVEDVDDQGRPVARWVPRSVGA